MSEGIDAALIKRNRQAVRSANPLFDQLNVTWEKIENFFRSQGILQPTSISIAKIWHGPPGQEEEVGAELFGVQKHKGKWRLCHGADHFHYPEDTPNWTPVSECSVELRVALLESVAELFKKLVETNEKYIPEMEKAVAKSHATLRELGIKE